VYRLRDQEETVVQAGLGHLCPEPYPQLVVRQLDPLAVELENLGPDVERVVVRILGSPDPEERASFP
jgi:hypothetical protein